LARRSSSGGEAIRVRLRRWSGSARHFGRFEWWLLAVEAPLTLAAMSAGIRLLPLPGLAHWATTPRAVAQPLPDPQIATAGRLVSFAGRCLGFKCLVQSLAVARVLARRGIATDIHLGVQPEASGLNAHAWVERQGRALNDRGAFSPQFIPINRAAERATHV
jgi:hypothetical protein